MTDQSSTPKIAITRLLALNSQLSSNSKASSNNNNNNNNPAHTMADTRPWITCHVLDTVAGKPGAGIDVTLTLISPAQDLASFSAKTNSDGRVTAWRSSDKGYFQELNSAIEYVKKDMSEGGQMVWSLKFDSGRYFGEGNTFWPEVELRFATKVNEAHYHVPLLLGPWSYTTYRGS